MSALTDAELAEIENDTAGFIRSFGLASVMQKLFLAIRSDRKEIARLRGIEKRAKELLDNGAFCEACKCDDTARYILEGEGKVSEPDACHEEGK